MHHESSWVNQHKSYTPVVDMYLSFLLILLSLPYILVHIPEIRKWVFLFMTSSKVADYKIITRGRCVQGTVSHECGLG